MFQFRVSCHGNSQSDIKLQKKYSQFQHLQSLVNQQAIKQSDLFGDKNSDPNRSYKESGLLQNVPKLEDSLMSSQLGDRLSAMPPSQQNSD